MINGRKLTVANVKNLCEDALPSLTNASARELIMELSIRLECPECHTTLPLPVRELSPGRRQTCERCQTQVRLTSANLDRFARDLRCYCEA